MDIHECNLTYYAIRNEVGFYPVHGSVLCHDVCGSSLFVQPDWFKYAELPHFVAKAACKKITSRFSHFQTIITKNNIFQKSHRTKNGESYEGKPSDLFRNAVRNTPGSTFPHRACDASIRAIGGERTANR